MKKPQNFTVEYKKKRKIIDAERAYAYLAYCCEHAGKKDRIELAKYSSQESLALLSGEMMHDDLSAVSHDIDSSGYISGEAF